MDLFKAGQREKRNMTARRFPPPWSVEDIGPAFLVKDNTEIGSPMLQQVAKATPKNKPRHPFARMSRPKFLRPLAVWGTMIHTGLQMSWRACISLHLDFCEVTASTKMLLQRQQSRRPREANGFALSPIRAVFLASVGLSNRQ
jgi:hypothetical protein